MATTFKKSKIRLIQKMLSVVLVFCTVFMLTGCESKQYSEAVDLFDAGKYDEAEAIFKELGDYEDSQQYLDRMGWSKFYAYVKDEGPVKIKCSDEKAEYDIKLSVLGDTVEAAYIFDAGDSPTVRLKMEYLLYLEQGAETATLKANCSMTVLTATFTDEGTTRWDISAYEKGGKAPSWDEYDMNALGTTIQGDPVEKNPDLGMCKEGSGSHETAIVRLVSGIESVLEETGLDTTMADLGFKNY